MTARYIIVISAVLASALLASACSQLPPESFLTPEFEEVSIDDSDPSAVRFVCEMSSMTQLTEYGLVYTDDPDSEESDWMLVNGTRKGDDCFEVVLYDLVPGTTYRYRMFIGNDRDLRQSATNYYTTPI